MKPAKFSLVSLFITLSVFSLTVGSSCKKNNDKRTCPTGIFGANCDSSSISLYNNTFTGLFCTSNGFTSSVPPKSGISISGRCGTTVSVTQIFTKGASGDTVTWSDYSATIPTSGQSPIQTFNVIPKYFFLYVKNANPAQRVLSFDVNYGTSYVSAVPGISVNDSAARGVGYYTARSDMYVHAHGDNGKTWDWPSPYTGVGSGISIPDTINAMVTLITN